ncbi:MAG TPA: hypothetical protein VMU09_08010 [Acidimicrobiales bacterium]|nr:hypothetical protein [Acidimicrobiales bacterium]
MDRSRKIAARVLVGLGLIVASLSLSAWWAQAVIAREFPLVTSLALHDLESQLASQVQTQLHGSGLTPAQQQAATHALDDPAVRQAIASGGSTGSVSQALAKADPALAPLLAKHPLTLPPVGRTVTRDAQWVRPIAAAGLGLAAVLCGLALLVGTDRFRLARSIGWWGLLAGGLPLLVGRVLPHALGLAHGHGAWASVTRTELAATESLVGLSVVLCAAGAVLALVGTAGPYAVRWVLHGGAPAPGAVRHGTPGAGGGIGMPPGAGNAWSASGVDVRL